MGGGGGGTERIDRIDRIGRGDAAATPGARGDRGARGERGEALAVAELVRRGYRIVERNFRCRLGELDVVARDGATLVFVEVRSRGDARFGGGLAAVPARKLRQVARVAAVYLAARRPRFETCRFDVVAVTGDEIEVVRDAFRITW